jgi:peroxiredoxin
MITKLYHIKWVIVTVLIFTGTVSAAQLGWWSAKLHRSDGKAIPFTFEWKKEGGKSVWYIYNAAEKIKVSNITVSGDSFFVQMPVFESQFRFRYSNNTLSGFWIKGGALQPQVMPFTANTGNKRFPSTTFGGINITGKWAVDFADSKPGDASVAIFKQAGRLLSGTFLNPTGDYRYLEGTVTKDSLFLSCFDGGHAFLFTAKVDNNKNVSGGSFYSGAVFKEEWSAVKNARAKVPEESVAMYVKPGEDRLHFSFNDLEGKPVSMLDAKFKNKVVIVQIMGSWCPNCMDETAFLSDYYNKNRQRGVEVIALGYEYSTDWERSVKSLQKFRDRYNVQYTILNTGVAVSDSLRTEKTLPELTPIKFFPSSIIIDKKGKIRKLDTGFNGPATGEAHLAYKKWFEATIDQLLNEQ